MTKRLSLTLDSADAEMLDPFIRDGVERDTLVHLAGAPHVALNTDASVLRTLVRIGAAAARPGTPAVTEPPARGVVYRLDVGHRAQPWVVVSNSHRNRALDTVLVARITTTAKTMPTRIDLAPADPLIGQVLCDDLEQVYGDELGALAASTMTRVNEGLRLALAL